VPLPPDPFSHPLPTKPQADLTLGKKLGSGAFGTVFRAVMAPERPGGEPVDVVVKKARPPLRVRACVCVFACALCAQLHVARGP
jgi:hypothetical protein